ncbi:sulfur carrier protein ThiS [Flavobacteriaceae bacterium AU392]|nr:sulfur carrier protein ThiS [Flavobacteriaceae bacterium]RKM84820.1 sulfur carrier protein ThiS [Flavobacteriaceae bacterium AU392]
MITIYINEVPVDIEENNNLLQLLKQVNSSSDGIAIAVNREIIPKEQWKEYRFSNKDNILIIQATQGG